MASQLFYAVAILCALSNGVVGQFTESSCVNLLPLQGGTPTTGTSFFGIPGVANPVYVPGVPIEAFLAGPAVQSCICQARRQDGSTDAVGTFTVQPGLSLLTCPGSASGTLVGNGIAATVKSIVWVTDVPVGPITIWCIYIDSTDRLFQQSFDIDGPPGPPEPCSPNPCQNSGSCVPVPGQPSGFVCVCPTGNTGDLCENDNEFTIDDCPDDIVGNNPVVPAPNLLCRRSEIPFALATCDQPPTPLPLGITTLTCSCQDAGQTVASCSFDVRNGAGGNLCNSDPCDFGEECRLAPLTQAGYTCHSSTGIPCPGVDDVTIDPCPAVIREATSAAVSIPNLFCRRNGNVFGLASCNPTGPFPNGQTTVTCTCVGESVSCDILVIIG